MCWSQTDALDTDHLYLGLKGRHVVVSIDTVLKFHLRFFSPAPSFVLSGRQAANRLYLHATPSGLKPRCSRL